MEDEAELIKQNMQEKRAELSEKLQHLERQVTGEVASSAGSVTQSVANVAGSVTESVTNVAGGVQDTITTVKDLFDLPKQVQEHPWLAVGGAVVVGYLAHSFLSKGEVLSAIGASINGAASAGGSATGTLAGLFGGEVAKLQRFATLAALQLVGRAVKDNIPGPTGEGISQLVEQFSASLQEPSTPGTAPQNGTAM